MAFLTENGNIKSSMSVDWLWIVGELPTTPDSHCLIRVQCFLPTGSGDID